MSALAQPSPSCASQVRDALKSTSRGLCPLLHLVKYYPLLFGIVILLFAFMWGKLMPDYDAFHIVWNEQWSVGLLSGIGVAFLLGEVMLLVYLLDGEAAVKAVPPGSPTQLPKEWWYAVSWWVLLFIALLPAIACPDEFRLHDVRGTHVLNHGSGSVTDDDSLAWRARLWLPIGALATASLLIMVWRILRARNYAARPFAIW